jgi:very-short-patch-repair endonuclease
LNLRPFDERRLESDFEANVYDRLREYIRLKNNEGFGLSIHNQVPACYGKRLDFVIYNAITKKSVVIEVDGAHHFENDDRKTYTEAHLERIEVLERAGWKIINTQYYKWYSGGWLSPANNDVLQKEINRLYEEINNALLQYDGPDLKAEFIGFDIATVEPDMSEPDEV